MSPDRTEKQSSDQQHDSQRMSLRGAPPPTQIPGYEPHKFLGEGAYGQVWVFLDRNTGRRVAVKFYTHRSGVDWSLLSREVEKLAYLSADRYIVQLFDVGWDADPPYYVMEYLERGSLEDRLAQDQTFAVDEAVRIFRGVVIGLLHAHGKGVLHCDLKPANVLLDQDDNPRLADFGQSRLSHEQTPALGTLFYMAPEQADTEAAPDARWDVYALGAMLFTMLTGSPPHRDETVMSVIEQAKGLEDRLRLYRSAIRSSPTPSAHRQVPGVDRALADIIDRCLQPDVQYRFANVQEVLDALEAREQQQARRSLLVLGALGPLLLLAVVGLFAIWSFNSVVQQSDASLTDRALRSNVFAARFAARAAGDELSRRYRAVEAVADDPQFQSLLKRALADEDLAELRRKLKDPALALDDAGDLREAFLAHPLQQELQAWMDRIAGDARQPPVASWFVNDNVGLQMARNPASHTIGRNYAWRTYFSGFPEDRDKSWRPGPNEHLQKTNLSAVFLSQASGHWIVTISTPVHENGDAELGKFLGAIALTVEVGGFVELRGGSEPFAVLVDWRDTKDKGLILQHPLFDQLENRELLAEHVGDYRLQPGELPDQKALQEHYVDPIGRTAEGAANFNRHWLAHIEPVQVDGRDTGWNVIVQQSYDAAIGSTLEQLKTSLLVRGGLALALSAAVLVLIYLYIIGRLGKVGSPLRPFQSLPGTDNAIPAEAMPTMVAPQNQRLSGDS